MMHNFTLLYTLNIKKSTDFNNILGVFGAGAKKHQQGFRFFINRIKKYLMEIKKQGVMKYKEFNKK